MASRIASSSPGRMIITSRVREELPARPVHAPARPRAGWIWAARPGHAGPGPCAARCFRHRLLPLVRRRPVRPMPRIVDLPAGKLLC